MRVLRTIESFYPFMTGPANQAFMISKKLHEKGIESPIFTTNYKAENSPSTEVYKGIKVRRFRVKRAYMKYLYTPVLKKDILKFNPDIIHAHNYRSYQTEIAFKAAKELNIPFIINTHGGLLGYKSITKGAKSTPYRVYDLMGGKGLVNKADAVIVSSKQEYDEAVRFGVKEDKLHIIPMGIDVSEYQKIKRTRKDDKTVLLFVGRICRDRNVMPILEALKVLNDDRFELRVVGGAVKRSDTEKAGYLDELKRYAKKNKLNVVFTGLKYDDDLKKEYRNADIFIYTSLWENFGQTMLEAAAAGLPIIATDVGIANDIVINGKTGFITSKSDENKIAEHITELFDKNKRGEFGKEILKIVRSDFNWDDIIIKYMNLYRK